MVRKYKRKTEQGKTEPQIMKKAVDVVLEEKRSVRAVAKEYKICHVTLRRYIEKKRKEK
jgi:response regulator of citrate/malate metabolism